MKKLMFKFVFLVAIVAAYGGFLTSCSDKEDLAAGPAEVKTRSVSIPANTVIRTDTNWSQANNGNTYYLLEGKVWVDSAATLTIEPGTIIRGAYNSNPVYASALIITRYGKLIANGDSVNPIVMTADEDHQFKGGWGGLVLLGNAQINQTPNQLIEGISTGIVPPGVDATYGTNDPSSNTESSGSLKYVRVEYAGASIAPTNELNAFTFGGVGSETIVEHCQAYYGADDAFEFFGGRVNAKYLVATACDDDCFDFDFGYQGKIQFAVSTIDPAMSYSSDPNGIECDNDGAGSSNTPYTHPYLSNLTIVGTSDCKIAGGGRIVGNDHYLYNGARFRRNTQYTLVNSIIYGYPTGIWNNTANTSTCDYNVVSACSTCFLDFPTPPTYISTTVGGITLSSPFGNYKSGALAPNGGYALDGLVYTPIFSDPFFDTVYWEGGAWDPYGNYWLADSWVR